jgi:acyl-coenzyme A thioesterase PaaI-like protein
MRRHRFMYGKTLDGGAVATFCDAAALESRAEAFKAVIGQMMNCDRARPATAKRDAYLRSLLGLDDSEKAGE